MTQESKMAVAIILFLQKWLYWPRFLIQGVRLHQHTKFDHNPPIRGVVMPFNKIQDGGGHLKFWLDCIFGQVI